MWRRSSQGLSRSSPPFARCLTGSSRNHPNPAIGLFIRLSRSAGARYVPRLSIWHEYDAELTVARERVQDLKETPANALAAAQQRMQRTLDHVMRRWDAVGNDRLSEWRSYDKW